MKTTEVTIKPAKGRPILQWVGKRPLKRMTALPRSRPRPSINEIGSRPRPEPAEGPPRHARVPTTVRAPQIPGMRRWPHMLWLLLLVPTASLADGVSPVLNFFHTDTWLPASIVTLVIILVESGLLRWRIRQVPFLGSLWRSIVLNAASSVTGSVLLLAFGRDSFFMWDTMSMVLPLFLITLATEIPLLRLLYRQISLAWQRACFVGVGINVASYACVFAIEIGLLSGWIAYAGRLDKKEQTDWQSPQLLSRVTGRIYGTVSPGPTHGLRLFDPQAGAWTTLTNCPSLDPNTWDVAWDVCAYIPWGTADWKERHLVMARLPEFCVIHDMEVTRFMDHDFDGIANWQGVAALSLSPDARHLAILFRYAEVAAYKDASSYYALGSKCRVIVVALDSGREIARAPRWASDRGVCWLPDARTVLFSSFDDEKVYQTPKSAVRGDTGYGIGDAKTAKFPRSLFAFRMKTGDVARFADGSDPCLALRRRLVMVRAGDALRLLDPSGRQVSSLDVSRLGYRGARVSPDGTMAIADMRRHSPFSAGGTTVLIDVAAPATRHFMGGEFSYKYVWTDGMAGSSNPAPEAASREH